MKRLMVYVLAATSFVVLICVAVLRWSEAEPSISVPASDPPSMAPAPVDSLDDLLASAEAAIVTNDPFRLGNVPASVRYDPREDLAAAAGVAQPPPLRPTMTLRAIVGGPPWQAVVDGLPGQPANTIVRAGSTYDKLVARSVTRDSVVIQGPDTTWVLRFRRPE